MTDPPVTVCSLTGSGCGEVDGEQASMWGPPRDCPRCGEPGGHGYCPSCHAEYLQHPLVLRTHEQQWG